MRPTTSDEIRRAFLDFFAEVNHEVVASAPLPQYDNPTLLFTNAGMNQFADLFLGKESRSYKRAATAQKVMRVQGKHNDLENVGPSPRHHTFFEMLGNFSFGDYFKEEAIKYAWHFVTTVMQLPEERLFATVFTDDDEAADLWRRYLPAEKILRFGEKDNFWSMGEVGPCGPCSEIFCYIGEMENMDPGRLNAEDDEEFVEIWNLVFMQFNRDETGHLEPLPHPSVDTGMGLERIVRVVQNGESNYDTDLFLPLMERLQEMLGDSESEREAHRVGYRVIADHGRAATFLIGDGVRPGSTGAGYVLRMIIRRAARFGRKIGFTDPFLAEVAKVYIHKMGEIYPELKQREAHILNTLTQEERKFARTLDTALHRLQEIISEMQGADEMVMSGEVAFDLYATYGLPLEITRDVLQEYHLDVDEAGYNAAREAHAIASGSGAFGDYQTGTDIFGDLFNRLRQTGSLQEGVEYDPYHGAEMESELIALVANEESVAAAETGAEVAVITAATPFYVESGGEVSDTGWIVAADGRFSIRINDTRRPVPGLVVHFGEVTAGKAEVGALVELCVNDRRRADIRRNHTATHILHQELRNHLGEHVTQQGSLVAPDRLRFDFSHHEAVGQSQLAEIEQAINQAIMSNYPVKVAYMGQKEAINAGAMALFGEKYGDIVRTIQIGEGNGERPYSFELCGGLHVSETNDIGLFRFTSEGASSAGVRRVEAVTGRAAQELIANRLDLLNRLAAKLNVPISELEQRLEALQNENRQLHKQREMIQNRLAAVQFESLLVKMQTVSDVKVLAVQVEGMDIDGLRNMADRFRDRQQSGVAVLATVQNGKPLIIAAVTKDLIPRGVKAGDIVREVAKMVGGGGGGRPDMAQAGGRHPEKLPEALEAVPQLVEKGLN